jgi:hypothetical protein
LLKHFFAHGRVLTECPISMADGVKAADVAWVSSERIAELAEQVCFPRAPEVCVEVISPRDNPAEIREKKELYFDAGALEVWLCTAEGVMSFFHRDAPVPAPSSTLCPEFPREIRLR